MRSAVETPDDLAELLGDWRTHLRAKGRQPATIASYLTCGTALRDYLAEHGMPTGARGIAREHVEHYLAAMQARSKPATVAKHYRSLQQLFKWLPRTARYRAPRWSA